MKSLIFLLSISVSVLASARVRFAPVEERAPIVITGELPPMALAPIDLPVIEIPAAEPEPVVVAPAVVPAAPATVMGWPAEATYQGGNVRTFFSQTLLIRVIQHPDYQMVNVIGLMYEWNLSQVVQPALKSLVPNKKTVVMIASGGGYGGTTQGFIDGLRSVCPKGRCIIETQVIHSNRCASNCITLFMVGDVRTASTTAQFGFHSASQGVGQKIKLFPAKTLEMYADHGISNRWMTQNFWMLKKIDVTYLTPSQIRGSNIVTNIILGDESQPVAQVVAPVVAPAVAQTAAEPAPEVVAPESPKTVPVGTVDASVPLVPAK